MGMPVRSTDRISNSANIAMEAPLAAEVSSSNGRSLSPFNVDVLFSEKVKLLMRLLGGHMSAQG